MQNPFLIGERVYLRPLDRADASLFTRWLNDPRVNHYLAAYRPMTLQTEEEFIDRVRSSEHDFVLMIVSKDTGSPLGSVGLHQVDYQGRRAAFGILLGEPEEWGKGHGTEATRLILGWAFETLNLNRVWLQVYEYNERGLRCYERVGFRREGVLRQDHYAQGRYWDVITMGILRSEWDAASGRGQ